MAKPTRARAALWWMLLLMPVALIALLVWPGLGQYGEGVLPEVLAPERTGDEDFVEFARLVRLWCGVTLALACLAALAYWFWLRAKWRSLLRLFDPTRVLGYRRLVFGWRFLGSLVTGAALGATLMLVSAPMRGLSAPAWVVFLAGCTLVAGLQYVATVFAVSETRSLYSGRYR